MTTVVALGLGCSSGASPTPPSILLIVVDTLRADAVSAYGNGLNTTPTLDALAAEGRLYTRAYSPSPWTIPSHASLFTGAGIDDHGVGLHGRVVLPETATTLAERLADAGYDTAAFSENALISPDFGFGQGFAHFAVRSAEEQMLAGEKQSIDVVDEVGHWLRVRDPQRPFFVFVNLYDAHEPYAVRPSNPFLPPGLTTDDARRMEAGGRTSHLICDRLPGKIPLDILQGLYLGEVASADQKIKELLALLESSDSPDFITLVTSDHGEHFGEHRLLDHEFSVHEEVLRIPLLVHGTSIEAARIDVPTELRSVARTLVEWAGADSTGLTAPSLASPVADPAPVDLVAIYSDHRLSLPAAFDGDAALEIQDFKRQGCNDSDRVFGDMLALTRFPYRLNWYARYPNEVMDLRSLEASPEGLDPPSPEVIASLEAKAQAFAAQAGLGQARGAEPLSQESEEALRSLGYID